VRNRISTRARKHFQARFFEELERLVRPNVTLSMATGVLIVEDEFLLRADAADSIERAGFQVYQASNADDAIRVLETHEDIRVVFTDINMPGSMDGLKLAHYVRRRWPPIKLV
jgi:CheY-like chemotaxis protein